MDRLVSGPPSLYIDGVFSTVRGAGAFVLGITLDSVIMTAVFNHTRQSVLVAVVLHWLFNVLPGAVLNMYAGITSEDVSVYATVGYGLVCVALVAWLGPDLERGSTGAAAGAGRVSE